MTFFVTFSSLLSITCTNRTNLSFLPYLGKQNSINIKTFLITGKFFKDSSLFTSLYQAADAH